MVLVGSTGRRGDESRRRSSRSDERGKGNTCKGDGLVDGLERDEQSDEREARTYVDVGCFGLDDGDFSGLVPGEETGGCGGYERDRGRGMGHTLENGACGEGADRDGGEEGGEEEKVLWADDDLNRGEKANEMRRKTDGVVIFSVEVFEETGRPPAAAEDDEGLFVGVERELRAGMAVLVGDVVEGARRWRE